MAESLREFSTAESWTLEKQSLRREVGAPVSLRIARLTVYDNPPNAPSPGIYIAADFNSEFELAPIHCGYLMWFRGDDGDYRIVREETGHVTAEMLATIPSEQVPIIRQRLRCIDTAGAGAGAVGISGRQLPFNPFPEARVSLEQWNSYHAEVQAALGATAMQNRNEQLAAYFDEADLTQYIFTWPGNPAHPAWIARRIVSRGQVALAR